MSEDKKRWKGWKDFKAWDQNLSLIPVHLSIKGKAVKCGVAENSPKRVSLCPRCPLAMAILVGNWSLPILSLNGRCRGKLCANDTWPVGSELLDGHCDQSDHPGWEGPRGIASTVTEQLENGLKTSAKGKCNLGSSSMVKQNKRRWGKLSQPWPGQQMQRREKFRWGISSHQHPPPSVGTCQLFTENSLWRNRAIHCPWVCWRRQTITQKQKVVGKILWCGRES